MTHIKDDCVHYDIKEIEMTRDKIQRLVNELSDNSSLNYVIVKGTAAGDPGHMNYEKNNLRLQGMTIDMIGADEDSGLVGMRFFQHPVFAIARADDPLFINIKRPEVVGEHHLLPEDWLPGAKSVLSVFLPYEHGTVEANTRDPIVPAIEWVYTRVDGQRFLLEIGAKIRDALIADSYLAIVPCADDRCVMQNSRIPVSGTEHIPPYSTNWSERHVGYVAGLGTFGMSTNFISKAGCAGRLISIITDWETAPDVRDYDDWLGYCNRCGTCIKRCQAKAHFHDKHGKDHDKCLAFMKKAAEMHAPRYGCGKCQSGLPCDYKPMKPQKL